MTIYKNISVPVRCTDEIEELYNVRDMLMELKETTEKYNKPFKFKNFRFIAIGFFAAVLSANC